MISTFEAGCEDEEGTIKVVPWANFIGRIECPNAVILRMERENIIIPRPVLETSELELIRRSVPDTGSPSPAS